MQLAELNALIDRTATLMAQYERRGAAVDAHLRQLIDTLETLSQRLPDVVRASTGSLVQSVPAEVAEAVGRSLDEPLRAYCAHLRSAGDDVARSSKSLAVECGRARVAQRLLVWKTLGALIVTLALLLGGGAWLARYYVGVVRANQLSAEVMQAYHDADVVLCGGHELCANIDPGSARYGDSGQYRPVRRR